MSTKPQFVFVVLAAFVAASPTTIRAQCLFGWSHLIRQAPNGHYYKWPTCSYIPYSLSYVPANPPDAPQEIEAAFSKWNALSDQYQFFAGQCAFENGTEGCGVVEFTTGPPGQRPGYADAIPISPGSNVLAGFYIELNLRDYQWTTTCDPTKADVQTIMLHEIGHAIARFNNLEGAYTAPCPTVMKGWDPGSPCWDDVMSFDATAIAEVYPPLGLANLAISMSPGTCDFNPAAEVADFHVRDGVATWTVQHEWQTKEYVLEGSQTTNGAGTELVTDPPSLGMHSVPLPETSFPIIRLVEVGASGRRHVRSYDTVRNGVALTRDMTRPFGFEVGGARRDSPQPIESALRSVQMIRPNTSGTPTVVVYATPALAAAILSDVAPFWVGLGHVVEVVDVDATFPQGTELQGIKSSIGSYAAAGTKYFHLVGDWEDDYPPELWSSTPYWQSKYNAYRQVGVIPTVSGATSSGIPTFRFPDGKAGPNNTAQSAPYIYTDQWYADIDNDDVPDVVVTRWPFREADEVAAAAERLPLAESTDPYQLATFLVGDAQPNGPGSIEITNAMVDELKVWLDGFGSTVTTRIRESDYLDVDERNSYTAVHLNGYRPDLIVGLGTISNRLHPMQFFRKDFYPPPPTGWDMDMLEPDFFTRLVLAASCNTATWISPSAASDCNTQPPCTSVCDDFLSHGGAGALAWIGSTTGTLQGGCYAVARYVIEELMNNPYRPMAESWLVAMQRAYSVAAPEYVPTLMSFAFLGDPLSPYRNVPDCTIVARARRADGSEVGMPSNFAVGCPQGDKDDIVVEVRLNRQGVIASIPADALMLSQPTSTSSAFYPDNAIITADSVPTFVAGPTFAEGYYQTTFTIQAFGGCGMDSSLVSLFDIPLGYAHLNIKSPDVSIAGASHAKVDLSDFATLGASYTSPPKPYNGCVDFVPPIGAVNLGDFAVFSAHFGHAAPGGGAAPEAASNVVSGTVVLEFEENHPLLGEHTLRATVSLEGIPPFKAAMFALRNENPKLEFTGWAESPGYDGETISTETIRDGHKEVFIGVLDEDAANGDVMLGTAEFRVISDQQLTLTDEDLALVTADLLSSTDQRSTLALNVLAVRRSVTSVLYKNELAQNYPNPFNPTTTISFSLAQPADASLSIYDVRGALVKTLHNGRKERGIHRIVWDGTSSSGQTVASGVYFYKLVAGSFTDTKKMTILK